MVVKYSLTTTLAIGSLKKLLFPLFQQPLEQWAIPRDIFQLHDGRDLVPRVFARSSTVEKLLAVGSEIQIDVPVVKHVPRGAYIAKFNIRTGCPEVRQHALGQAGSPVLLAENLDRNVLRHAPQQVERLYIQVVIYNQHRLLRHAVNLRIGDICLKPLPVQNQKVLESVRTSVAISAISRVF